MTLYFIKFLPSLDILDISSTNIGVKELEILKQHLNHSNIQVLKVGSRGNTMELTDKLVDIFVSNCSKHINICFSGISRKSLLQHSSQLPFYFCCSTPDLNMSNCKLSTLELSLLVSDLATNSGRYHSISLANCGIDDEAASYLSPGLKYCSSLETLGLSFNDITSKGALCISENLKYCTKLQKLDLSFNRICDGGALDIIDACKDINNLNLYLSGNPITKF